VSFVDGLNEPQREAVLHDEGPLVVFAGAGSGKTRVITHRVARLIAERGVKPWRILAVTFTNKAAGEMRHRLEQLVPGSARDLWVGTFHATCARLLRRHGEIVGIPKNFTIYDDTDQRSAVTRAIRDLSLDDKQYNARMVAAVINNAKQAVKGPDQIDASDSWTRNVQEVFRLYEKRLAAAHALDFDDLIGKMVVGLEQSDEFRHEVANRFSYVLVDEFQDTNVAQLRMVLALCQSHRNVCVVGDDDQSIYSWRGADRRNILDFRKFYPDAHVVKLEQNYRSTKRILRAAYAVISKNVDREPKQLWTENDDGPAILVVRCEDERDEAKVMIAAVDELAREGRSHSDMAVFYRSHAQSRVLEEALRARNIAYRIVGGMRFYDRAEVKDALAYLRVLTNPEDDVSLLRIINVPPRGIGKTTIDRILESAAKSGIGVWNAIAAASEQPEHNAGTKRKLAEFRALIESLRDFATSAESVGDIGAEVIAKSGYATALTDEDSVEADSRLENLAELVGSMREYDEGTNEPSLASYLELITLQTSVDEMDEADKVTLMTVHAAKGLEFPAVMVTGLEETTFPVQRGGDPFIENPEEIEEERRLAYVAFTRARERLILSYAGVRNIYGQMKMQRPSRFLSDLPREEVQFIGGALRASRPSGPRIGTVGPRNPPRYESVRTYDSDEPDPIPGESYVDRSEGSDIDDPMHPGAKVRHAQFGVGVIVDRPRGIPPRVRVKFRDVGEKTVVAAYLLRA
jgi:DNA helicase-2/ATP-dependent DNA helicase PcrA